MSKILDFYFDFSSPYAYIASERVQAIANKHALSLNYHAILLGFIYPVTGQQPLVNIPLIAEYTLHDIQRSAREHKIKYQQPSTFPVGTVAACRGFYWIKKNQPELVADYVQAIYRAFFIDDRDISKANSVLQIGEELGLNKLEMDKACNDSEIKILTKSAVEKAIALNIFGSPFFRVNGEAFWGNDRLDELDRLITKGGW
jgi:2-hydroxychromene-2-carboxylate isomerase